MVETEGWPVASLVRAPIVSAVVGAAVASRQARKEREKRDDERFEREHELLLEGMKILMRSELIRIHTDYVQAGKPVPIDLKEQAEQSHDVYAGLGGNGTGTHLWQEIRDAKASE